MKMERKVIVICCLVGFLGLFSAATGFAAEAMRKKGTNVEFPSSGCVYTFSPSHVLAIASAMTLMAAKITVATATCLVSYRRRPHQPISNGRLALISALVSLFTYLIALYLLITGAAPKDQRKLNNCFVVKPGAFSVGAVLSFTCVVFGIIDYLIRSPTEEIN